MMDSNYRYKAILAFRDYRNYYLFVKFHQHDNLVLDRIEQVVLMDQVKHITVSKSKTNKQNFKIIQNEHKF